MSKNLCPENNVTFEASLPAGTYTWMNKALEVMKNE